MNKLIFLTAFYTENISVDAIYSGNVSNFNENSIPVIGIVS